MTYIAMQRQSLPRLYDAELIEHAAVYAAERGDSELEDLCDLVLAGDEPEETVFGIVRNESDLQEWMLRPLRRRSRE